MEETINQVFRNRTDRYQDRLAIEKKKKGKWEQATWNQYYANARAVGLALRALGMEKGDRVSLLSDNCLEWLYTDMGVLGAGGCVVPIYPTLTDDEVAFIVSHSDSKFLFVENEVQLKKALFAAEQSTVLKKIILFNDERAEKNNPLIMTFSDLLEIGVREYQNNHELFEKTAGKVEPGDLATIVYTSGTTGRPKGAMITHKNIMAVIEALDAMDPKFGFETDQTVPFLPLSHVFERIAGHFFGMYAGITASYAEGIETILADIQEKRPTEILAVPRVLEKVYQKIIGQVQQQSFFKQSIFYWGQKIGAEISTLREQKKTPPLILKIKFAVAYKLIFKKLQSALGGRVRWMTASGAPTAKEIILFFNSAGIMVVEGYGMTETCAPATMSNLADYRIGTVGRAIPGVDIRIAPDGEILIKGDNVFMGYWKQKKETADVFTPDGYLMSGDIGTFDEKGFLTITDRKKDLIITSGGKNIAPQNIENLFKSDPLFAQFIVIGEKRKYLTALVNINPDQAALIAAEKNIPFASPVDLYDNAAFLRVVEEHLQERNSRLARYETIKKIAILRHDFSQQTGELTATLKVKRRAVQEMYKGLIDTMYDETVTKTIIV